MKCQNLKNSSGSNASTVGRPEVTISRARFSVNYPASFMLVASMNPSPSGYFPDDPNNTSSQFEMQRYMNKLSGPVVG